MDWGTSIRRRLMVAVEPGARCDELGPRFDLSGVLALAAGRAGLHREIWHIQPAGNGELAVLPAAEPEWRVVDDFVRELDAGLADYDRHRPVPARLRLRVAIHFGVAIPATQGYTGTGVVAIRRVLDSQALRRALDAAPGARLAAALTARVFENTVVPGLTSLPAQSFRRIGIDRADEVWLYVPGQDIHALDLSAPACADPTGREPGSNGSAPRGTAGHHG